MSREILKYSVNLFEYFVVGVEHHELPMEAGRAKDTV